MSHDLVASSSPSFDDRENSRNEIGPEIRMLIDLFWAARRRMWLVALFVLCGAGLGYLLALQSEVFYMAQSRLWIQFPQQDIVASSSANSAMQYYDQRSMMNTQIEILKSPLVVDKAIEEYGLLDRLPKETSLENIDSTSTLSMYIRRKLQLERSGGESFDAANVIEVGFSSPGRKFTTLVVDSLTQSYRSFVALNSRDVASETVDLIQKAHDQLNKDIKEYQNEYQDFLVQHDLPMDAAEMAKTEFAKLDSTHQALTANEIEQVKIRATLDAISKAENEGWSSGVVEVLVASALNMSLSPTLLATERSDATINNQLLPLMAQEKSLMAKFGDDYPQLKEVRNTLEMTRAVLNGELDAARSSPPADTTENQSMAERLRSALDGHLDALVKESEDLNAILKGQLAEAAKLHALTQDETRLRQQIANSEGLFQEILAQMNQLNLVEAVQQSGSLEIRELAKPEIVSVTTPGAATKIVGGGVAGLLLAVGLANLLERAYKKVHSLDDVRHCVGARTVIDLPILSGKDLETVSEGSQLAPVIQSVHRPRSRFAEQFRKLRTALLFAQSSRGRVRTIQVTSSVPSEGKSMIASNLAVTLAKTDKRVILVDADVRRPKVASLFSLENTCGLVDVLMNRASITEAVQATEMPNLALLTAGRTSTDSDDLLSHDSFGRLLDHLRETYDVVILDSPPILAVADPDLLATQVDALVFSVRMDSTPYATVNHCRQWFESNGLRVTVAVANGVGGRSGQGGGYYYGHGSYYYGHDYTEEDHSEEESSAQLAPR